jgi:hypothetical protein
MTSSILMCLILAGGPAPHPLAATFASWPALAGCHR